MPFGISLTFYFFQAFPFLNSFGNSLTCSFFKRFVKSHCVYIIQPSKVSMNKSRENNACFIVNDILGGWSIQRTVSVVALSQVISRTDGVCLVKVQGSDDA